MKSRFTRFPAGLRSGAVRWIGIAGFGLALACSGDSASTPSIVIISVDTLRADYLGCYGHPRDTSPNIDAFARESLLFENASSHASTTWPSLASLMSGFLPHETLAVGGFELGLVEGVDSLAEILGRHGYRTAAVVGNWGLVKERGWSQGFDVFDDVLLDRELVRGIPERVAERTTDRAIELLGSETREPLLLWVHYQDPHGPYTPPEAYRSRFLSDQEEPRTLPLNDSTSGVGGIPSYQQLGEHREFAYYRAQYEGEIRYLDDQFGRLIAALRERGLYHEAFIVFTADHGETMGEHDNYFGHGQSLDPPLLHIPLVLRFGSALHGRRADAVQHLDVVPTLLAVAGIPADPRLRGRDLRDPGPEREIVAEHDSFRVPGALDASIVSDGYRLFCWKGDETDACELFDLGRDPQAQRNLAADPAYADTVVTLKERLESITRDDRLGIDLHLAPEPISADEREALRKLGYAD